MARRPPSHPKQAWEEVRAPQESSSPAEPYEVTTVQPLQMSKTLEEEENAQHPDVQPKGQSESPRLFPLPHSSVVTTGWVDLHVLQAHLKHPSPAKNFLALRALVALSEEEEMARRMRYRCLLDDILLCLRNPYADSRVSALLIFHNLMGHLKKKSRAIALLLVDELPPFFDDESIQVQELSISLLRKMVESVEGGDELEREEMKKKIWRALLPLLFHLNDQTDSVAQATQEALLTCADLLDNEKLKRRVKRKDTRKIGKLLLEQDKRRLPDHLNFCMKSMADTRASVRLQAVSFMGIAVRRLSGTQDQESLWKMCSALHRLEKDPDLEVRSQAAETLVFLRSLLKKGSLGWFRWVLCCWL